jgi:lipoprotein NlpD
MRVQGFLIFGLTLLLLGCSSRYQAPVGQLGEPRFIDTGRMHRVNDGETLYVIAWMYDLDFAALARINNLREPYNIAPGQMLTVDLRGQPVTNTSQNNALAATNRNNTAPGNTAVTAVNPVQVGGATVRRSPLPSTGGAARPSRSPLPGSDTASPPPAQTATPPAVAGTVPANPAPSTTGTIAPLPSTTPSVPTPSATTATSATTALPSGAAAIPPAAATLPAITAPLPSAPDLPLPGATSAATAANKPVVWAWPHGGNIVGGFSESGSENKGIDFAGNAGDAVLAAADGEVVYAGSGLLHYGNLIIIKHSERFLSAYAHNRTLVVQEKERVSKGQKIAELGSSGIDKNMLHFEIRVDGKPADPLQYLPAR